MEQPAFGLALSDQSLGPQTAMIMMSGEATGGETGNRRHDLQSLHTGHLLIFHCFKLYPESEASGESGGGKAGC